MCQSESRTALVVLLLATPAFSAAQQVSAAADRDIITAQQIATVQANTALEAVEKLRPDFLRRAERPQTIFGRTRASTPASSSDPSSPADRMLSRSRSTLEGDADASAGPLKIVVFVDGARFGDARDLKRIPASEIREIRFLSGSDAQQQYGAGHGAGVIHVALRSS